jgi:short-subunit dehydrogenase
MNSYILITGASTGIGAEMAKQLAEKKYNLILVARSEDKLEQLKTELISKYQIEAVVIVSDLSQINGAQQLYNEVKSRQLNVTHLVNNAGFGEYGHFVETSLELELNMIQVNVTSLVVLTKLFAQDMVKNGAGRIMNVASIVSFIPLPYYAIYSSTKTFVLAFSETIAAELEGTGVVVTALCPGAVETPFHTPNMRQTMAMKLNQPISVQALVREGVQLLLTGKGKKVVGFINWLSSNLPRILPDVLMMKIKKQIASPYKK